MRNLIFIISFLFVVSSINAQDDFQKWLEKDRKEFKNFISEQDKQFADFLKKGWKEFALLNGLIPDKTPKPTKPPVVKKENLPQKPGKSETKRNPQKIIEENPVKEKAKQPKKIIKRPKKIVKKEIISEKPGRSEIPISNRIEGVDYNVNNKSIVVNFYDTKSKLFYPANLSVKLEYPVTNNTIAKFWEDLASTNFKGILTQLLFYKGKMQLNDWAYLEYVNDIARKFYPTNRDERYLFDWFFLTKSGYRVKVGIVKNKVYLFVPAKQKVYDISYIKIGNNSDRFYIVDVENPRSRITGEIYTYPKDYPNAVKLFNLAVQKPIKINENYFVKELSFNYNHKKYVVKIPYPEKLVLFYKKYPYVQLDTYFNASVNKKVTDALLTQLKEYIKGMSETEASNFLLSFSQHAFDYKTDQQQFGIEKPFFVEETIYYPYSDCEDRSIFFAFLVKNLLGLKIIGVDYPGHVATAIKFNKPVNGDYILYKGEKYIVCDPTYIGAGIGMAQPQYRTSKIENIIRIN